MRRWLTLALLLSACPTPSKALPPPSPEELAKLRADATKAHPARPKDWAPETNDRVLYRSKPSESWQLYDVLWDPPLTGDTLRELWQPKDKSVTNSAKLSEVYPYPAPGVRPRAEVGDLVACVAVDPNLQSNRDTRTGRVLRRTNDWLDLFDVEANPRRVHASDCLRLEP